MRMIVRLFPLFAAIAAHPGAQLELREAAAGAEILVERVDVDDDALLVEPALELRKIDVVGGVGDAQPAS